MGSGGLALKSVYVLSFYFILLTIYLIGFSAIIDERNSLGMSEDPNGYLTTEGGTDINLKFNQTYPIGSEDADIKDGRGVLANLYSLVFYNININSEHDVFMQHWWIMRLIFLVFPLIVFIISIFALGWI